MGNYSLKLVLKYANEDNQINGCQNKLRLSLINLKSEPFAILI